MGLKRNVVVACWGLLMVLLGVAPVYGADILHRLIHSDQDALVIGKILSQKGSLCRLSVARVVSGRLNRKTVLLSGEPRYSMLTLKPQPGDWCVASLERTTAGYRNKWGLYKVAAMDKKLKLEKKGLADGLKADLTALEWYLNSNGKDTEFFFDGSNGVNKAYLRKPNGDSVQIYPEQ